MIVATEPRVSSCCERDSQAGSKDTAWHTVRGDGRYKIGEYVGHSDKTTTFAYIVSQGLKEILSGNILSTSLKIKLLSSHRQRKNDTIVLKNRCLHISIMTEYLE
jgi:hypothetical protein